MGAGGLDSNGLSVHGLIEFQGFIDSLKIGTMAAPPPATSRQWNNESIVKMDQ
jgi:hypothetical protein